MRSSEGDREEDGRGFPVFGVIKQSVEDERGWGGGVGGGGVVCGAVSGRRGGTVETFQCQTPLRGSGVASRSHHVDHPSTGEGRPQRLGEAILRTNSYPPHHSWNTPPGELSPDNFGGDNFGHGPLTNTQPPTTSRGGGLTPPLQISARPGVGFYSGMVGYRWGWAFNRGGLGAWFKFVEGKNQQSPNSENPSHHI